MRPPPCGTCIFLRAFPNASDGGGLSPKDADHSGSRTWIEPVGQRPQCESGSDISLPVWRSARDGSGLASLQKYFLNRLAPEKIGAQGSHQVDDGIAGALPPSL